MTNTSPKKLSRRDAIKLIGAVAGASVLANLPSKWDTPQLAAGVLPAHAQTSSLLLHTLSCDLDQDVTEPNQSQYTSGVTISPPTAGIVMRWTITSAINVTPVPIPNTDTVVTDGSGYASLQLPALFIVDPSTSTLVNVQWQFENAADGDPTDFCDQAFTYNAVLPAVTTDAATFAIASTQPVFNFFGTVTSEGSSPVTVRGFVWGPALNPTLPSLSSVIAAGGGLGAFSSLSVVVLPAGTYHLRAYATSTVGTAYGADIPFTSNVCLAEGTLVSLANGTLKKIEDVEYSDWLRVWNFDEGRFDAAQPLWVKKAETASQYNLLEFSDGSSLKTISQHRIFNQEKGMFTYPMTDDSPLGTTTFNVKGEEVTLVSKRVVNDQVRYYNVITYRHMNLFANGILTSCRYNNIYPIVNMKFVKDDRELISQEMYGVGHMYYEGLRLAEQTIPVADTIAYINRLEALKTDWTEYPVTYPIPSDEVKFIVS